MLTVSRLAVSSALSLSPTLRRLQCNPIALVLETYTDSHFFAQIEAATQKVKEVSGLSAAEVSAKASELSGEAKGKASELAGQAQGKANELSGQAKGAANTASKDGSILSGETKGAAAELSGAAKGKASE